MLLRPAVAVLVDDASLGITRYDFRGVWNSVPGILTVYLRPVCIGRTLFVRGVLGVITVKLEADSSDGYTAPASLVDYNWALRLVDRSTNTTTKVRVYKAVDRGERTLTFSQLEAQLQVPNQLDLFVEGSPWRHELYLPDCVLSEDSDNHPLKQLPGGLFNDKHWVVVMLPRELPVPTEQYSQLILSHMRYHQQLGFSGTLLLCDMHQAHELTQLQDVNAAVQQDSIIMWPWVSRLLGSKGAGCYRLALGRTSLLQQQPRPDSLCWHEQLQYTQAFTRALTPLFPLPPGYTPVMRAVYLSFSAHTAPRAPQGAAPHVLAGATVPAGCSCRLGSLHEGSFHGPRRLPGAAPRHNSHAGKQLPGPADEPDRHAAPAALGGQHTTGRTHHCQRVG